MTDMIVQIVKFDGGETSAVKELARDGEGRHWSRLVIEKIQLEDSGEYICQPAAGAPAMVMVTVHVQRETEVQAVLGEGELLVGNCNRQGLVLCAQTRQTWIIYQSDKRTESGDYNYEGRNYN